MLTFLKKIFIWWNRDTFGTRIKTVLFGKFIGSDEFGNKYYESKKGKRWVIYANEIDAESQLKNIISPLQDCAKSKFIPSSSSDLYNNMYLAQTTKPVKMTNNLLFKKEKLGSFNPNPCGLGYKLFNNFTRQQTMNLTLRD